MLLKSDHSSVCREQRSVSLRIHFFFKRCPNQIAVPLNQPILESPSLRVSEAPSLRVSESLISFPPKPSLTPCTNKNGCFVLGFGTETRRLEDSKTRRLEDSKTRRLGSVVRAKTGCHQSVSFPKKNWILRETLLGSLHTSGSKPKDIHSSRTRNSNRLGTGSTCTNYLFVHHN